MTFCFEDLDPDSKEFLKKHVPSAVNCKSLDELLLELDDFITSTFDENDEPTALSREGERARGINLWFFFCPFLKALDFCVTKSYNIYGDTKVR